MHGCLFELRGGRKGPAVVWLALVVWTANSGLAAPVFRSSQLAEMDQAVTNAITQKELPGAVLWLEREGAVYHKAFGHRSLVPTVERMTDDTIFDAASLTKVLATTPAILLLHQRGRLLVDDLVRKHLPEFSGHGTEGITLRHLLTHTSGLRPGLPGQPDWTGYQRGLELACRETVTNAPGTIFRYSDINFILLGEVVQRVAGRPLADFAAAEIFGPLRMVDTGFLPGPDRVARIAPTEQTTNGMLRGKVHDPTARRMGGVAGHAGVFTTAADVARFARMILNGGELDGFRLFTPETVRSMTSVQSPDGVPARRGLGWDIDSPYSRPRGTLFPRGSFGHTGWTGAAFWVDPFSKTFWVFLSNRVHPNGQGNVLSLYSALGTLAAQAVDGFDFSEVAGALPFRSNFIAAPAGSQSTAVRNEALAATHPPLPGALNGIDVLVRNQFAPLRKLRIGLVTNHTGQDRWRNPTIDLLYRAPEVRLLALFSPEHGLRGTVDESVGDGVDDLTGLPVHSLYPRIPGKRKDQTEGEYNAMVNRLRSPPWSALTNLDALVFDIQDIGCRFYTYIATLGLCLESAARAGLQFFVLDRVNPINASTVEGPVYHGESFFTAWHDLPLRHGMTLGELARMFDAERNLQARLTVVPVEGWSRESWFDATGQPWKHPSPNMRSLNAAALYPGIGLHETALSVGRGTDTPFEVVGAPYIDDLRLAAELNQVGLPGIRFVPVRFTPTASVFKGQECRGVSMLITARDQMRAVDVGIQLALTLHRLYPGEYPVAKLQPLLRDERTLEAIQAGRSLQAIKELWASDLEQFRQRRARYLLYP